MKNEVLLTIFDAEIKVLEILEELQNKVRVGRGRREREFYYTWKVELAHPLILMCSTYLQYFRSDFVRFQFLLFYNFT